MPPLVYKSLGADKVTIRPFKVHKTQVLSYTSGSGSGSLEINIATGIALADVREFDSNTSPTNEDGSYQEPLYETVVHTFYDSALYTSRSITFPACGDGDRGFTPEGSLYVVNVDQRHYGEGIRRGTFVIDVPVYSGSIVDDSAGKLYVSGALGEASNSVVGNVFYNLGVAVVNRLVQTGSAGDLIQQDFSTSSLGGIYVPSGSVVQTTFDAALTIYEYQTIATINPGEFNYSINPSAYGRTAPTGSVLGPLVIDAMATGSLSPYVTTIGLYNDHYELIAIAKVPRPIKRIRNSQQSFVIRFDI